MYVVCLLRDDYIGNNRNLTLYIIYFSYFISTLSINIVEYVAWKNGQRVLGLFMGLLSSFEK